MNFVVHGSVRIPEFRNIPLRPLAGTFEMSQRITESSLKELVPLNVPRIFVTALVSQSSGALKASAPRNVSAMFVTALVFQTSG